jgi:hypothetical protein
VRREHVEAELLHEAGQAGGLAFRQVQHEPGQRRRVDDRVLERALEAAADEPAVESVVAVLDEDGALCEPQESPARVAELGSAYQHRSVDVVPLFRVRVDRRAAVDQCVEERQRTRQLESLGPQLEHQEWGVAGRLDVDGDELCFVQRCLRPKLRRVDRNLFPGDRLGRASRLEEDGLHDVRLSAPRRNWISSRVIALRSKMAAA